MEQKENVFEFYTNTDTITATVSQGRYIRKILELKEKYPKDCKILQMPENNGGYLLAEFPVSWLKLNHSVRELSEKEKGAARERLKKARESRKSRKGGKLE